MLHWMSVVRLDPALLAAGLVLALAYDALLIVVAVRVARHVRARRAARRGPALRTSSASPL